MSESIFEMTDELIIEIQSHQNSAEDTDALLETLMQKNEKQLQTWSNFSQRSKECCFKGFKWDNIGPQIT